MILEGEGLEGDSVLKEGVAGVLPVPRRPFVLTTLLLLASVIWGATFLVTQRTIQVCGLFTYLALCFAIGALSLSLLFRKRLVHLTRVEVYMGVIIGICLFAGYALQTSGLQYTTSSKAGFITGMYVPFVPLLSFVLLRQKPSPVAIFGVVLSVIGLALLSITTKFDLVFGLGEWLLLGCAFAFALQIIFVSRYVVHADAIRLTIVQLATTSLLSCMAIPIVGEPLVVPPPMAWVAILFMGLCDMAFTFVIANWAQQYISSTRVTLIYALESAWAALFGVLAGQILSLPAWVGCGSIFLGMVVGVLRLPKGLLRLKALARP